MPICVKVSHCSSLPDSEAHDELCQTQARMKEEKESMRVHTTYIYDFRMTGGCCVTGENDDDGMDSCIRVMVAARCCQQLQVRIYISLRE